MKKDKSLIKQALKHHRWDEDVQAIEILESEQLANNADAMLLLGQVYATAQKSVTGVSRSYPKARKCWMKALELGNYKAANELADMYYLGDGVKENYKKAEEYWLIACEAGDELAAFYLVDYYYDHNNEKIDKAIELCHSLIARDEFVEQCCIKLARIYHRGLGVAKDIQQAIYWLEKGVALGHGNSCMDLAMLYYRGEGVKQDVEKAISLVEQAGTTEWLKDEAPVIAQKMRDRTLLH